MEMKGQNDDESKTKIVWCCDHCDGYVLQTARAMLLPFVFSAKSKIFEKF